MNLKKLSLASLAFSALLLGACQNQPSTLNFVPPQPQVQFNASNQQSAIVNVFTRDLRAQPEISSYVLDGQVHKLSANPAVSQLFQQVMQQNLNSKGIRLGSPAESNTNVAVNIQEFYAQVDQGNLRYDVKSSVKIEVQVQGASGQFNKRLSANRNHQGAFTAKNDEIQKVLGETFKEVVNSIYQDQEIVDAINRYSR